MKFTRKTLKNGVTLLLSPMKDSLTATVFVMVKAGSKYENKANNGISHFLEHMCFKGTAKRPTAKDISIELDALGSQYNAFTSYEFTGYYAKAHPKHLDTILDVVSDIYANPVFDPKEIEKEKGVIVEEMNMYEDLPHRQVQDLFSELLYGDQPVGWAIIGSKQNVKGFTQKDFLKYRDAHYVASATTVIVTGNIDARTITKKIEMAFAGIPRNNKGKKVKVVEKQSTPIMAVKKKETDQTHLVMGVRTFPSKDKRSYALTVMDAILGGGMSSRLWQKLRDEMGVGYYVRSGTDDFTDHGFFSVSVGADPLRVKEVITAVLGEFRRLCTEKVSDEELAKTKEYLIGNTFMSLESSDAVAEFFGMQEMTDEEIVTPEEMARRIRAVTTRDIQKLAQYIFKNDRLALAIIGNKVDEKGIKKVFTL